MLRAKRGGLGVTLGGIGLMAARDYSCTLGGALYRTPAKPTFRSCITLITDNALRSRHGVRYVHDIEWTRDVLRSIH